MDVSRHAALLIACLWLLVACEVNPVTGDEAVLKDRGRLTCSETCLSRGACRPTGPLGRKTVYVGESPAFPGASEEAFTGLGEGTEVTVLQTEVIAGVEQGTGELLEIRFYRIDEIESETTGWVPGFCLMRQP
jgi:hypothetical protein